MSWGTTLPLRIGGITLQDFTAPEVIGDFGSFQKCSLYEFLGGTVSAQLQGRFPKLISFSQLMRHQDAMALSRQIDQLTASQEEVTLSWAAWSWQGIVLDVKIEPANEGEVRYTIGFRPFLPQNVQSLGDAFDPEGLLNGASGLAQNQVSSPSSGYTFPSSIVQNVSTLRATITQTLSNSANNIASIPAVTISSLLNQIAAVKSLLTPLIQGSDPQAASAAADLNNTLQQASNALSMSAAPIKKVSIDNPNLFTLATQYYGNPALAYLIAEANNLLDWQLAGEYELIIPQNPNTTAAQVATLL